MRQSHPPPARPIVIKALALAGAMNRTISIVGDDATARTCESSASTGENNGSLKGRETAYRTCTQSRPHEYRVENPVRDRATDRRVTDGRRAGRNGLGFIARTRPHARPCQSASLSDLRGIPEALDRNPAVFADLIQSASR